MVHKERRLPNSCERRLHCTERAAGMPEWQRPRTCHALSPKFVRGSQRNTLGRGPPRDVKGPTRECICAMNDTVAAQLHGASDSTADAKHAEPSLPGKIGLPPLRSTYQAMASPETLCYLCSMLCIRHALANAARLLVVAGQSVLKACSAYILQGIGLPWAWGRLDVCIGANAHPCHRHIIVHVLITPLTTGQMTCPAARPGWSFQQPHGLQRQFCSTLHARCMLTARLLSQRQSRQTPFCRRVLRQG